MKMKNVTDEDSSHVIIERILTHMVSKFEECCENDIYKLPKDQLKFHSWKVPHIGLDKYLQRIYKYVKCSPICYIVALIYIDRAIQRNQYFFLTKFNAHRSFSVYSFRLIMASLILAIKFCDDTFFSNIFYSKVAGVSCREMNSLEAELLKMIDYELCVSSEEYKRYEEQLNQV